MNRYIQFRKPKLYSLRNTGWQKNHGKVALRGEQVKAKEEISHIPLGIYLRKNGQPQPLGVRNNSV
jgi:hypothetical protein